MSTATSHEADVAVKCAHAIIAAKLITIRFYSWAGISDLITITISVTVCSFSRNDICYIALFLCKVLVEKDSCVPVLHYLDDYRYLYHSCFLFQRFLFVVLLPFWLRQNIPGIENVMSAVGMVIRGGMLQAMAPSARGSLSRNCISRCVESDKVHVLEMLEARGVP